MSPDVVTTAQRVIRNRSEFKFLFLLDLEWGHPRLQFRFNHLDLLIRKLRWISARPTLILKNPARPVGDARDNGRSERAVIRRKSNQTEKAEAPTTSRLTGMRSNRQNTRQGSEKHPTPAAV